MSRRLSRNEQRERTRSTVLEAAGKVFPRRGYHLASVDEIAAEAGLTSGAVYSNFASKADLFLAVYEEQMDRWVGDLVAELPRRDTIERRTEAAVEQWQRYLRVQQDWFTLFVEFWSQAVKDPDLRGRFATQYARLRMAIADLIAASADEFGIELPLDAEQLGLAVNALGNGLALDKLLEPEAVPDDLYRRVLDLLFASLLAAGQGAITAAAARSDAGAADRGQARRTRTG